jgi:radical SAM superfamily enzyme YgiQ (UPF0313 family)
MDLMVVGEWMPITLFANRQGRLKKVPVKGLESSDGFWNCIESADLEVRKCINKGARSLDRLQEKIAFMLDLGMSPKFNFILGLPGESLKTIDGVKELIHQLPSATWGFSFLTVFPGTPLEQQAEELGIWYQQEDENARFSLMAPSVSTPTMSQDDQVSAYLSLQWERRISNRSTQVAS